MNEMPQTDSGGALGWSAWLACWFMALALAMAAAAVSAYWFWWKGRWSENKRLMGLDVMLVLALVCQLWGGYQTLGYVRELESECRTLRKNQPLPIRSSEVAAISLLPSVMPDALSRSAASLALPAPISDLPLSSICAHLVLELRMPETDLLDSGYGVPVRRLSSHELGEAYVKQANDPSSATRPTRRHDCN